MSANTPSIHVGDSLCELLTASGAGATADALALEITSRVPTALWAWRRRAFAELAGGSAAAAVVSFQAVLRGRPGDAASWEGLGAAYEGLGRLTAGLKVECPQMYSLGSLACTLVLALCSNLHLCAFIHAWVLKLCWEC